MNSFQDYISVRSVLFYTNFKDNFKETQISIEAKLKCAKLIKRVLKIGAWGFMGFSQNLRVNICHGTGE